MAIGRVHQREIVEVPFTLPDGQIPYFNDVVNRIVANIIDGAWE